MPKKAAVTTPKSEVSKPNVCYLRLSTGDELIGDCLGEGEENGQTFLIVKSPMVMSEVTNPFTQSVTVALSKYIPLGDFTVLPINRANILFVIPVIPEMTDYYHNSVLYNDEFVTDHIAAEMKMSSLAVRKAIINEQRQQDMESMADIPGKTLVVPSNTSVH